MPEPRRRRDALGIALLRGGDPLASLRALADARKRVEGTIAMQIARAMRDGASWADVGRALGVSRQAARARYRERAEEAAGALGDADDDPPVAWPTAGFAVAPGAVVGLDAPEAPREGATESELAEILADRVDDRFYLSPRAAAGVLRRAERAGKAIPEPIASTLRALAASDDE